MYIVYVFMRSKGTKMWQTHRSPLDQISFLSLYVVIIMFSGLRTYSTGKSSSDFSLLIIINLKKGGLVIYPAIMGDHCPNLSCQYCMYYVLYMFSIPCFSGLYGVPASELWEGVWGVSPHPPLPPLQEPPEVGAIQELQPDSARRQPEPSQHQPLVPQHQGDLTCLNLDTQRWYFCRVPSLQNPNSAALTWAWDRLSKKGERSLTPDRKLFFQVSWTGWITDIHTWTYLTFRRWTSR